MIANILMNRRALLGIGLSLTTPIITGCSGAKPTERQVLRVNDLSQLDIAAASKSSLPGIRSDLFDWPSSPVVTPLKPTVNRAAPVKTGDLLTVPEAVDPLNGNIFKGFVSIDGERMALLEDAKTGEGRYIRIGDEINGVKISGFDNSAIKYVGPGGERTLAMNAKYSLTPLSKGGTEYADPSATGMVAPVVADSLHFDLSTSRNTSLARIYSTSLRQGISDDAARKLQSQVFDGKLSSTDAAKMGLSDSAGHDFNTSKSFLYYNSLAPDKNASKVQLESFSIQTGTISADVSGEVVVFESPKKSP